jgi:hypothetical protein
MRAMHGALTNKACSRLERVPRPQSPYDRSHDNSWQRRAVHPRRWLKDSHEDIYTDAICKALAAPCGEHSCTGCARPIASSGNRGCRFMTACVRGKIRSHEWPVAIHRFRPSRDSSEGLAPDACQAGIKLSALSPGQQIDQAIAFLDACYQIKPASRLYERALCYNMLAPFPVRDAITSWSTDVDATLAALRQVRVPTLITQGTHDVVVHPDTACAIAQAIPRAQLSWFEGAGHSPFQEDVPRFNRELVEFVRAAR